MKTFIIAFYSVVLLAGCATPQSASSPTPGGPPAGPSITERLTSTVASLNESITAGFAKASERQGASAAATSTRIRLRDTALKDAIANSASDQWPRVALTINRLPSWFYQMPPTGQPGHYSARDCINISMTAWSDQKTSKSYDNMEFCGDDIVRNTPFSDIGIMWKNFGIVNKISHTGAQRTRGPLPPHRLFPNQPGLDGFFHVNGSYYLGSIMATVGYNWKEPQDYRFWIVNLPTQAQTSGR